MTKVTQRLFLGGLCENVTTDELTDRFKRFGTVQNIDIRERRDSSNKIIKTFGYVNLEAEETSIKKCIDLLNNTRWRGSTLLVQKAKESHYDRIKREREMTTEPHATEQNRALAAIPNEVKGAPPGTKVDGKEDWVVGKYGRVLPIVSIRKHEKRKKIMTVDPSKFTHAVKSFDRQDKNENGNNLEADTPIDNLTWQMDEKEHTNPNIVNNNKLGEPPKVKQLNQAAISAIQSNKNDDFEIVSTSYAPKNHHLSSDYLATSVEINGRAYHSSSDSDIDSVLSQCDQKEHKVKRIKKRSCRQMSARLKTYQSEESTSDEDFKPIERFGEGTRQVRTVCGSSSGGGERSGKSAAKNINSSNKLGMVKSKLKDKKKESLFSSSASDFEVDMANSVLQNRSKHQKSALTCGIKFCDIGDSVSTGELQSQKCQSVVQEKDIYNLSVPQLNQFQTASKIDTSLPVTDNYVVNSKTCKTPKQADSLTAISNETKKIETSNSDDDDDDILDMVQSGRVDKVKELERKCTNDMKGSAKKIAVRKNESRQKSNKSKTELYQENLEYTTTRKRKLGDKVIDDKELNPSSKLKTSKTEEEIKQKKKEASNKARLESLTRKASEKEKLMKRTIQDSIKNVDKSSNKKIIFDSDDEENSTHGITYIDATASHEPPLPVTDCSAITNDNSLEAEGHSSYDGRKLKLFDSESEDEKNSEVETMSFEHKSMYEGKRGAKLMKLQKKIGKKDPRFLVDERFYDSNDDSGSDEADANNADVQDTSHGDTLIKEADLNLERYKTLSILEEVVGRKALGVATKKVKNMQNKGYVDMTALRYDPTKDQGTDKEINTKHQKEEEGSIQPQPTKTVEKATVPDVKKDIYYKVKDMASLETFGKSAGTNTAFSFASLFGSNIEEDVDMQPAPSVSSDSKPVAASSSSLWDRDSDIEDRSSSEEDDSNDADVNNPDSKNSNRDSEDFLTSVNKGSTTFFPIDRHNTSAVLEFMRRKKTYTELNAEWEEKRPMLVEAFREKCKRTQRRVKQGVTRGGFTARGVRRFGQRGRR